MRQMTEYLSAFEVEQGMIASHVSNFLTGDAYNFWVTTVSKAPRKWTLKQLFVELFNYCFPVDYRLRKLEELKHSRQRDKTVRQYVHELESLFLMVGFVSDRDKVDKLWNGLRLSIQQELWKKELTPTLSTWEEVRDAAELIEIAEGVGQRLNSRQKSHRDNGDIRSGYRHEPRAERSPRTDVPRRDFARSNGKPSSRYGNERRPRDRNDRAVNRSKGSTRQNQSENPARQLSKAEKEELTAAGKCFHCKKAGHFMRDCPLRNKVKSERPGKPPGLTSFHVGLGDSTAGNLQALAEVTESNAGVDLATVGLGFDWPGSAVNQSVDASEVWEQLQYESVESLSDDGSEDGIKTVHIELPQTYRDGRPRTRLGDLFAERAEEVLNRHGPYCCPAADFDGGDEYHANVYRTTDDLHVIMHYRFDTLVETARLKDPDFDLPRWYRQMVVHSFAPDHQSCFLHPEGEQMGHALATGARRVLEREVPWPQIDPPDLWRYNAKQLGRYVRVYDMYISMALDIPLEVLENVYLDLPNYYAVHVRRLFRRSAFSLLDLEGELVDLFAVQEEPMLTLNAMELVGVELNASLNSPEHEALVAIQRNAAAPRDFTRLVPDPIVVLVRINGEQARALLDSGSLSDFMSYKFAHQIQVKCFELEKPLPVHLAIQGSRAKINYGCRAIVEYQRIKTNRYFDVVNLLNYDVILGTPFLFQHKVSVTFNPSAVIIGSQQALPIEGKAVRILESHAMEIKEDRLEAARQELREYAAPICKEASDSPLPPLRAINHQIPLIDEHKIYSWRPSRCPDALRDAWNEKRDAYTKSGRWQMTTARNTSPMLLLTKPGTGKGGVPPRLRVVCDLRERNANTRTLTSPLPDMESILRRIARHPYRSLIDGKDAYEQIRIEPAHVERTAMTTPDGNMVSLVLQQGDCNAVATYQSLMNYLFGPHIGVFLDVYLDDIAIYSDSLDEHVKHVRTVIDILRTEQLYLSAGKLKFLCREMKVLGRIVDEDGIRMDPDKVDCVINWKVPTNKELLRGFLGSVGYLADDIATIRIPMGILTPLTGSEMSFKWDPTHQRAFEEIKRLVHQHREHHRVPLNYAPGAPRIWLVTDGSHGGVAGVVTQGDDFRRGLVAAFFSAKLTAAQMNYPVHEIEMLAGVEAMQRHRDILLGCSFTWVTDHKGLVHLLGQRNLSGRQARWLEKISEFDFKVEHVPGVENVLADALSRIYSNDPPGTVRAASEYTMFDDHDAVLAALESHAISVPILVELEGRASTELSVAAAAPSRRSQRLLQSEGSIASGAARRQRRGRTLPPPPESGRPETAREFSKRIRRVVLHGPRGQRQEGEKTEIPDKTRQESASDNRNEAPTSSDRTDGQAMTTEPAGQSTTVSGMEGEPVLAGTDAQPLLDHISSSKDGIHLQNEIRGRYGEDPFFGEILTKPKQFRNFTVEDGLVTLRDNDRILLCVPNIIVSGRNVREIIISHAHSLLAHLGPHKTSSLLREHVWWKTLLPDVQKYCDTCMTCKRSKPTNQKPYGLLNPLPVPSSPWEAIGIDFVGPLPESKNRDGAFNAITTIIDLLTGMVHLVPSRTDYKAREVAELVFAEVYKHHGLPKAIISDRDVLFTSTFWTHLHKLIGMELRMSSAYHPESDGSTERANRTVSQMLRQCVGPNQRDWVSKLPAIEFAINMARSESTGYAPFFLNTGRMPRPMIWDGAAADEYPGVRAYAQKVKAAVMAAHDCLIAARVKQTRDANRRRRPAPFAEGDLVYVSTKNLSLPKGLARKLAPKYMGPYRILQDFGNSSFKLDLPISLKRRGIHDVFHSSLLRVHEPNDDRLFPGRLDTQVLELDDKDNEWAIEKFTTHRGSGTSALFEAVWKSGDRTWVPYTSVAHLEALNAYLEAQGVEKIGDLPDGTGVLPDDPQVFVGMVGVGLADVRGLEEAIKNLQEVSLGSAERDNPTYTSLHRYRSLSRILSHPYPSPSSFPSRSSSTTLPLPPEPSFLFPSIVYAHRRSSQAVAPDPCTHHHQPPHRRGPRDRRDQPEDVPLRARAARELRGLRQPLAPPEVPRRVRGDPVGLRAVVPPVGAGSRQSVWVGHHHQRPGGTQLGQRPSPHQPPLAAVEGQGRRGAGPEVRQRTSQGGSEELRARAEQPRLARQQAGREARSTRGSEFPRRTSRSLCVSLGPGRGELDIRLDVRAPPSFRGWVDCCWAIRDDHRDPHRCPRYYLGQPAAREHGHGHGRDPGRPAGGRYGREQFFDRSGPSPRPSDVRYSPEHHGCATRAHGDHPHSRHSGSRTFVRSSRC